MSQEKSGDKHNTHLFCLLSWSQKVPVFSCWVPLIAQDCLCRQTQMILFCTKQKTTEKSNNVEFALIAIINSTNIGIKIAHAISILTHFIVFTTVKKYIISANLLKAEESSSGVGEGGMQSKSS